ncbi:hypothetical protein CEQ90_08115 [Lewinellaceae bacterium SD302]|nr:hypothetical protein CEQ90_08115 [Lewinellaceae bacterium SD302]
MQRIIALLAICFLATGLFAQPTNNYTSSADSDPEALKLVKALKAKYEGMANIEAMFRMDIELPGQAIESQKGSMARSGDKFHFKLAGQEGISDGKAIYVIMHDNKSVNIENMPEADEESGMLTPQNLLTFYDLDKYIFALQGEETVSGKRLQTIELKPVDRDESEFIKLRMTVDAKAKQVSSLAAFSRDGSRFTFYLDQLNDNPALDASRFVFKKSDYPGYYVEDLRF